MCTMILVGDGFFFCKQKTAYEMRISDWSSDVCSSDLVQFDEQSEAGDAADHAVELAAHVLLHPRRAVAVVDFALGLVRAARALGALQRQRGHVAVRVAV